MKKLVFYSLLILTILIFWESAAETAPEHDYEIVSVFWDTDAEEFTIVNYNHPDWIAWANFSNQMDINGWSFLHVVTNENYEDINQAYAAGYIEGYLTCPLMYHSWLNSIDGLCDDEDDPDFCDRLWNYLHANEKWMTKQIKKHAATDPYWHQVGLILEQVKGLRDGCEPSFLEDDRHDVLKDFTFLLFSIMDDISSLQSALGAPKDKKPGSCSALIKWMLGDDEDVNADLYVSHVTWSGYETMIRILKKYDFYFHLMDAPDSPLIPGLNMTFSSYPGALQSIDDFYSISSGLVTLETTIENDNEDLWKSISPKSLFEFYRSMLANRLATNGQKWTELFALNNSGTYNNQWMIVDYKKFQPDSDVLQDGLLWIIEQLPGFTESEDRTDTLRYQGYWPSYNVPYFPSVFNLSGQPKMVKKYGDMYSYERTPRARIFQRDQQKVVDVQSMINLLRSNDYLNDPLSICNCTPTHNAMLALSSRGDLNPANGSYPLDGLKQMAFGGTDMKMTNYEMFQTLQFLALSGPTHESVPPFRWSTYEDRDSLSHEGMPDLWQFEPLLTTWD